MSFLSSAEDSFQTQLSSNTSGYSELSILAKITSKNQKSDLQHYHILGSL